MCFWFFLSIMSVSPHFCLAPFFGLLGWFYGQLGKVFFQTEKSLPFLFVCLLANWNKASWKQVRNYAIVSFFPVSLRDSNLYVVRRYVCSCHVWLFLHKIRRYHVRKWSADFLQSPANNGECPYFCFHLAFRKINFGSRRCFIKQSEVGRKFTCSTC